MGEELKNRKRKISKKVVAENNKPQANDDDKLLRKKTKKKRKSTEADVKNGGEIVSTKDSEVKERRAARERVKEADTKRSSRTGKSKKAVKKKRRSELLTGDVPQESLPDKQEVVVEDEVNEMSSGDEDCSNGVKSGEIGSTTNSEVTKRKEKRELKEADTKRSSRTGKSKRAAKRKKRSELPVDDVQQESLPEKQEVFVEDEVYEMSSGDEDFSNGMKKWIMQYHQSRPGLKVLQEKIDDFIMDHEAQQEQAKKEREAQAAEGGWTVVVHHKGRKKTTEAESGVAVGSVGQAAVLDKMSKKKTKGVGLDFYRFQKTEAQKSALMMLQSKFEQDKKRIQQMRAARKFRPY